MVGRQVESLSNWVLKLLSQSFLRLCGVYLDIMFSLSLLAQAAELQVESDHIGFLVSLGSPSPAKGLHYCGDLSQ